MNRTQKAISIALVLALLPLLGSMTPVPAASPESTESPVELAAYDWMGEDLGTVVAVTEGYEDGYDGRVWRVEGSEMTVIMDRELDLVGMEF
jgi:hypothetical protein